MARKIEIPREPTVEQIEKVFSILRMKLEYGDRGLELQDKYRVFNTSFGIKAAAYEKLVEYFDSGA